MNYIAYQTINLKNNKIYIGIHKTDNPEIFDGYLGCGIRITAPSSYMNPNTPLQAAVKKYGTSSFKRTILKTFDNSIDAFRFESEIVNSAFINRIDTYNAKLGGFGGSSYSIKINQFDVNGLFLKTWNSIIEASDFYSISDTAISNAYKFKGSCNNFFWSKNQQIDINEYTHYVGQICYKYNSDGKFIEMYNSLVEAAKENSTYLQSIQRSVKGGYKVGDYYYSLELHDVFTGSSKISLKNKSLYVYGLDGKFIIQLNNSSEIYNFFNLKSTSSITTALRTNRQYRNFQLSLEYYDNLNPIVDKRNTRKKVEQYTVCGDLITTYDSITEAFKEHGTGVQKVLKGQQKQCKGFIFKYIS